MMTNEEAKKIVKDQFMARYDQWLKDRFELPDYDFGRKYGWMKSEKMLKLKDNLTAVTMFHKYFFSGMTEAGWNRLGIESRAVWSLANEGFFYRADGQSYRRPTYYCITQVRAKEIWKEAKGA